MLAACNYASTDFGQAGTVSGTVRAPTGGDVQGTVIQACLNNDSSCHKLGNAQISLSGEAAPFELQGLPAGAYAIYATKNTPAGDYFGFYSASGSSVDLITPPATGVAIQMTRVANAEREMRAEISRLN